jgi:hypothetical protein
MDEFKIKEYNQRFWQVAEVFKNGKKIADINKFYDVTTDWIIIYDTNRFNVLQPLTNSFFNCD